MGEKHVVSAHAGEGHLRACTARHTRHGGETYVVSAKHGPRSLCGVRGGWESVWGEGRVVVNPTMLCCHFHLGYRGEPKQARSALADADWPCAGI